jgi:DNA invertase Pin-like site-specific DNA recombinase
MIAALYARVSTSDGRQEVDNQLLELRRFAASQNWEIVREYVDHESGGTAERLHFRQLLKDAAQCKFDVVLFWSLDRFTREGALATLQHLNTLTSYGVGYRSFSEPYLDSCGLFKDAIIAILGTIAKQERIRLSERVKAGLARAKRQGTRTGRKIGRPRVVFAVAKSENFGNRVFRGGRLRAN